MEYPNRFFKQYGAEREDNTILRLSARHAVLFYGFGTDTEIGGEPQGYRYRKDYDHIPSLAEIKTDIEELINSRVRETILSGFTYEGKPVWLSTANQRNFASPHTLPVRFKLGEDADGKAVYHTFDTEQELVAFRTAIADFINAASVEGWDEKDSIDYSVYKEGLKQL